jgi:putative thioredoxin
MQMSPTAFDTNSESFAHDVLEASHAVPVLVDFWAPWCAPCRVLKPILEKLATEYAGKFRLAKLNTDENPDIGAAYGVRGIPNVKAFVDGKVAHEFTGALPEAAVRAFLEKVIPSPAEALRRAASDLVAEGEFELAEQRLRDALASDATLLAARIDLAELLVARQDLAGAEETLQAVPEIERADRLERLRAQIAAWKKGQELPSLSELAAKLERDPTNPELRMALAERLVSEGQFEPALEELIEIVRATRGDARDQARKTMLRVFSLANDQADLVSRYRRLLAAELN